MSGHVLCAISRPEPVWHQLVDLVVAGGRGAGSTAPQGPPFGATRYTALSAQQPLPFWRHVAELVLWGWFMGALSLFSAEFFPAFPRLRDARWQVFPGRGCWGAAVFGAVGV